MILYKVAHSQWKRLLYKNYVILKNYKSLNSNSQKCQNVFLLIIALAFSTISSFAQNHITVSGASSSCSYSGTLVDNTYDYTNVKQGKNRYTTNDASGNMAVEIVYSQQGGGQWKIKTANGSL